ncbi:MAG TPA: hypothetical protein VGE50_05610 [Gammaproteobacteria bacterium]
MPALADEEPTPTEQLLHDVVRLGALAQSPPITAHLQLLQALIEIDLGMTAAAQARLDTIHGSITVAETVEQLRLLLALRRRQMEGRAIPSAAPSTPLPVLLEQERLLTLALQQQAAGDSIGAIALAGRLRRETLFLSPATLDRALLLVQAGQVDYAIDLLQVLGNSAAEDESMERLRDRANLVLARLLLARGLDDVALGVVERIRLDGPDGSAALLLLGWVKLESAGPDAALAPWMELSLRDGNDPAVLEGRLALPLALSRQAPSQQALDHLQAAIDEYRQRLVLLDTALAELTTSTDDARWLTLGEALRHGGSARASTLAEEHATLRALAQRWPVFDPAQQYDAEPLRAALLLRLRELEWALARDSSKAMWRELYALLHRYLDDAFAAERVTEGKRPLDAAPFAAERLRLDEAALQMRHHYRDELLIALQLQRRRVSRYLEQARFSVPKLYEQALLQQLEGS